MKQCNRLTAILLALALTLSLLPHISIFASAETFSGKCGDNLTWILDKDTGILTITGNGRMYDYDCDYKFEDFTPWWDVKSSIKQVNMSDGLTSIGDFAFYYCTDLISVTIPSSVISIGDMAFGYCTNLESVTIPDSVRSFGESAFIYCVHLSSVRLSESITKLDSAFEGCSSLKNMTILKWTLENGHLNFKGPLVYRQAN